MNLTKRIAAGARILQINFLDHVIVGQAMAGRRGYFSFQESRTFVTPEQKRNPGILELPNERRTIHFVIRAAAGQASVAHPRAC